MDDEGECTYRGRVRELPEEGNVEYDDDDDDDDGSEKVNPSAWKKDVWNMALLVLLCTFEAMLSQRRVLLSASPLLVLVCRIDCSVQCSHVDRYDSRSSAGADIWVCPVPIAAPSIIHGDRRVLVCAIPVQLEAAVVTHRRCSVFFR